MAKVRVKKSKGEPANPDAASENEKLTTGAASEARVSHAHEQGDPATLERDEETSEEAARRVQSGDTDGELGKKEKMLKVAQKGSLRKEAKKGHNRVVMLKTIPSPRVGNYDVAEETEHQTLMEGEEYSLPQEVVDVLVDRRLGTRVGSGS